jgi:CHAT domain-containing protein
MRQVTLYILGMSLLMMFHMCRESHREAAVESAYAKPMLLPPPPDSTLTPELRRADSLIQWRTYAEAREILSDFIELSTDSPNVSSRAKNMWCYALIRDDEIEDCSPALPWLREKLNTKNSSDTLILVQRAINLGFYYQDEPDSIQKYFDFALSLLRGYYEEDDPHMQRYYRDIGSYYLFDTDRIQESSVLFHQEERLHKKWRYPPNDRFLNGYNLGELYRILEEFDLAEGYQKQAVTELRSGMLDTIDEVVLPYASLCYIYAQKMDAIRLNAYIDTTIALINRFYKEDTTNLIDYHSTLAMCYIPGYVNMPKEGLAILEEIPQYNQQLKKYAACYGDLYRAKAYLQLGAGDVPEARIAMHRAIELFESEPRLSSYYYSGYTDALLGLGVIYLEDSGRVPEAMTYIQRASANVFEKPLKEVAEKYPSRYLKYYARWFDFLVAYGDDLIYSAPEAELIPGIIRLSMRIDSVIGTTRQKVSNDDALRNARLNHDIYTYMIGWCHEIIKRGGNDTLLSLALDHFEKSRAHLLLIHLSSSALAQQLNVPSEVIDEGIDLTREELATYGSLNASGIDSLLSRKQHYFQLLEKHYPEYYRKSYEPDRTSLPNVLNTLGNDEAMISFQLRDSQLYAIVISNDTVALLKSKFNSLCSEAVDALNALVQTRPSHTRGKSEVRSYVQTATQVFDCVLADAYPLINHKKQWWIAADGILELLPFEILLSAMPETVNSFRSLPYLVTEHTIGYALSATTWVSENQKSMPVIEKIAVFIHSDGKHQVRSFDQERDIMQYHGMPGTAKAAASIKVVYGNRVVTIYPNEKATTTTFLRALDQYDLLHLGLHAYADTTGRQRHGIVFPGDRAQLTVSDMIGKNIKASIVFLEGCETGVGKQARGEGTLNFARPFIAAGARHVLASRWKLDDQTAGLMSGYFYQQLKAGHNVAFSNCEAKRIFLKNARRLQSHPYYWAAVMSVQ